MDLWGEIRENLVIDAGGVAQRLIDLIGVRSGQRSRGVAIPRGIRRQTSGSLLPVEEFRFDRRDLLEEREKVVCPGRLLTPEDQKALERFLRSLLAMIDRSRREGSIVCSGQSS